MAALVLGAPPLPGQFSTSSQVAAQVAELQFAMELRAKLSHALGSIKSLCGFPSIGVLQVWRPKCCQTGLDPLLMQLYADPELYYMGDPSFASFRLSSCQSMQYGHQGMPGRVLKSGCVQVVQNLRIIPDALHPRSRLSEAVADQVGEVVYVPVFDTGRPHAGPVAVLEALLSAKATDSMLVANFISFAGTVLAALKLSLSNPLPQPVRRSKLEGRKPRPVHPDSSVDLNEAGNHVAAASTSQTAAAAGAAVGDVPPQAAISAAQQPQSQLQQCGSPRQQELSSSCGPDTPAASCLSDSRQHQPHASTTSIGVAASASVGTSAAGASGPAAADGTLDSTLSSMLRDSAAMPPPLLPAQSIGRQRLRWQQEQEDDEAAGGPPHKMQRTLSMVRTKSVPVGLDQALQDAVAAATKPAQSC